MKKIYGVFIIVLTVLSFVNCTTYASGEKPDKVKEPAKKQVDIGPVRKISDSPYHVIGLKDAPVVMLDFYSLTCPACADFHGDAFPEIIKNYVDAGVLKIQLYDFITDQVAMIGSKVSRCLPADLYLKFTTFLMAEQEAWAYSQNPVEELKNVAKNILTSS